MNREEIAKKSAENLKRYIKEDLIYQENKPESDFDQFCIDHCEDINNVLNYVSELEGNLYAANNIINDQIDLLRDSVSKDKIREYKEWYENTAKHLSGNGINLEAYENAVAISKFCNKLLSLEE